MPQMFSAQPPYQHNNELGPVCIILPPKHLKKVFTSGERIAGLVRVKTVTQATSVTISFKGRSSCSKDENTTFFSLTLPLFSGPGTIPTHKDPDHVDFPFELRFPETVELHPSKIKDAPFKPSDMFEYRPGYLLPPTFWANDRSAKIEYYLEAKIPADQMFFGGKTRVRQHIRFTPSVVAPISIPQNLTPCTPVLVKRQTRLLDSPTEHKSRLTRWKDTISREDAPTASFTINIDVPSVLTVGEPVPLGISLVHQGRSDEVQEPPVVFLKQIIAKAIVHINARVPQTWAPEGEHRSHSSEEIKIFSHTFKDSGLVVFDGMTLEEEAPKLSLEKIIAPSFRSYAITTTHDLKLKLVLYCAGKASEVDFVREGVVLLPLVRSGDIGAEFELPLYDEEVPPPYEG